MTALLTSRATCEVGSHRRGKATVAVAEGTYGRINAYPHRQADYLYRICADCGRVQGIVRVPRRGC